MVSESPDTGGGGFESLYARALHFGVPYGDLRRAAREQGWEGWSRVLEGRGDRYEELAGRVRSPASHREWSRRAVACWHFAQIRLPYGPGKERLQERGRRLFRAVAPKLEPPARPVSGSRPGAPFSGYLRSPGPGAPWVVLLGGLDSAKEVELAAFAEVFLERGCAVCYFDGPGQGELLGRATMPPNFAPVISAVLDALEASGAAGPFGLFGVSFGGHLACRAAAGDSRVEAVVCLGGFHDARILERLSPLALATVGRAFGLPRDGGEARARLASRLSLERCPRALDRPLLVVHGEEDRVVDREQAETLRRWARGPAELWVVEGAEHVCTDRFAECLPALGDWMIDRLERARTAPTAARTLGAG